MKDRIEVRQRNELRQLPAFVKRKKGGYVFPGSNPVSISQNDLETLNAQSYYICEKTEGERALLWICGHDRVFFDRSMTPMDPDQLGLSLTDVESSGVLAGTLLDGEIVWNWSKGQFNFLIFDVLCWCAEPVISQSFTSRMCKLTDNYPFYQCPQVQYKHFFQLSKHCKAAFDQHLCVAAQSFDVDGVILTPEKQPIKAGRNWKHFKWKPRLQNTVDLRVDADMNGFVSNEKEPVACVSPGPNQIRRKGMESQIWECRWSTTESDAGNWQLFRPRFDKNEANDSITFANTVNNIKENIQMVDLFPSGYSSKDVEAISKMFSSSRESCEASEIELEFRFDKVSESAYQIVHHHLLSFQNWKSVDKSHSIDKIKNNVRQTMTLSAGRKIETFQKKRLHSYSIPNLHLKCVISEEKEGKGGRGGKGGKPDADHADDSQKVREKRRVSFTFEEGDEDCRIVWAYDLTCINPASECLWEIEIECKSCPPAATCHYIAESGLMKCNDIASLINWTMC